MFEIEFDERKLVFLTGFDYLQFSVKCSETRYYTWYQDGSCTKSDRETTDYLRPDKEDVIVYYYK